MAPGPCRPAALCDVCKFRYHVKAAAPAAPVMKTAIKKAAAPAAPMPSRLFTKAIADVKREKAMPKAAAPAAPTSHEDGYQEGSSTCSTSHRAEGYQEGYQEGIRRTTDTAAMVSIADARFRDEFLG